MQSQTHTHTPQPAWPNEQELEFYLSHPTTRAFLQFSNPPQPQYRQQQSSPLSRRTPQSSPQSPQSIPNLISSQAKSTRALPAERYNVDMDLYFCNKDLRDEIMSQMLAATANERPVRARL